VHDRHRQVPAGGEKAGDLVHDGWHVVNVVQGHERDGAVGRAGC